MSAPGHDYFDTAPFWDGAREGRLMLQFCPQTQRWQAYPRPASVYTGLRRLEWRAASGRATLAAWTVDRMAEPAAGEAPRVQALVDLEEGPRLVSWLVGADPAALRTGQPLQVRWVDLPDGRRWPAFTPNFRQTQETP